DPNNLDLVLTSTTLQKATIDGETIVSANEPVIQSVTPAAGSTGVATNTTITATFNTPMSLSALQNNNFKVVTPGVGIGGGGGLEVPVSGTITMSGNTAVFTPTAPFAYGTLVTVTIATGTIDQTGKALLTQGKTWSFTTGSPGTPANFAKGLDQTVLEDAAAQNITGWATSISVPTGNPVFTVTNNNNALFRTQPTISPTGVLSFWPAADANGQALLTITLNSDAAGVTPSTPQLATITVTPVNDPPSFVKGPDVYKINQAGQVTIPNWMTGITAGPADEGSQAVTISVSANSALAFTTQPTIGPTGTLSFEPNVTLISGQGLFNNTMTITCADNGGTANGGSNTSAAQAAKIVFTDPVISLLHSNPDVNGNSKIGTDTIITLTFDQPIDLTTLVNQLSITYTVGQPEKFTLADYSQTGSTVYLTVPGGLQVVGPAMLDIAAGVNGVSGATLTAAISINFEICSTDNNIVTPTITAPYDNETMIGTKPSIGATNIIGYTLYSSEWEIYESSTISTANRIFYGYENSSNPLINTSDGSGLYLNSHSDLNELKPGTDYWVRVRYIAFSTTPPPYYVSEWSPLSKFTTSFPPLAPTIIVPISPTGLNPTLDSTAFSDPDSSDSLQYSEWQIFEDADMSLASNQIWNSSLGGDTAVNVDQSDGYFM
ncbi:MAG TPA: Ig-like domain-containing protein, partial [Candidatus Ozemobacteraceae bacterium]|nr:Ig-like domain-containing protein [Candidatus Ozemobacteraceae bacterium]